jgi:hypothetical protein
MDLIRPNIIALMQLMSSSCGQLESTKPVVSVAQALELLAAIGIRLRVGVALALGSGNL